MRAKWKGLFTDKICVTPAKPSIVYSRRAVILPEFVGRRFLIHNGRQLVSLLIRDWHINSCFGDFVAAKKIGSIIHNKSIKGKRHKK